jgi:TM2 domain-containing membrane protein YozV
VVSALAGAARGGLKGRIAGGLGRFVGGFGAAGFLAHAAVFLFFGIFVFLYFWGLWVLVFRFFYV